MVPLSGANDGTYDHGKQGRSATELFAAPQANRGPATPPAGPAPVGAVPFQGPVVAGPQIVGPQPVGPQPVMGIQGPSGMPGHSMGHYGGMAQPEESRSHSYRVFAVVLGLLGMVCMAMIISVCIIVFALWRNSLPEEVEIPIDTPPIADVDREPVDTGTAAPPPKPAPVRPTSTPRPTSGPRPTNGTGTKPKPKPEKPAQPAGEAGQVKVTIPPDVRATKFEISCPSGDYRERATLTNGVGVLTGVPAEDCKLTFKGGSNTQKFTVRPGTNLNCTKLNSSQLSCR